MGETERATAARVPQASYSRRVTLTVAGILFMLLLDGTILNTSLPSIAATQRVAPLTLSAAVTIYLLTGAAVLPLASWLAERCGLRRLFVASIALFTVASLLCGLAHDATQLIIARGMQGLGGGLMLPLGRTLALHGARREDLISVTALLTWPALFAPVLGPPLGGLITTYVSWRWNFFLNVPLGAVAIFLILRWVRADSPGYPRPLDVAGATGAVLGLVLLIGGLERVAHVVDEARALLAALLTAAAGIGCLAWTVHHLRRTPNPVVSLAPLAHRTFAVATATGGTFASLCLHATPFLLPLMFQVGLGHDAVAAGALLLPYFGGNLAMKSITTPILVRFGFRRVMVVTGACNVVAIAALGALAADTPWLLTVTMLVLAGCTRSTLNTLMFADVPLSQRSAAATLSTVSMQVASALGVAVGAIALAIAQSVHGHEHLTLVEFRAAFLAVAGISALTVLQFWRLPSDAGVEVTRVARD